MSDFAATAPAGNNVARNERATNAARERVVIAITKRFTRFSCASRLISLLRSGCRWLRLLFLQRHFALRTLTGFFVLHVRVHRAHVNKLGLLFGGSSLLGCDDDRDRV